LPYHEQIHPNHFPGAADWCIITAWFASEPTPQDSLHRLLASTSDGRDKVHLLLAICRDEWKSGNYSRAKKYADEALAISEKINFENGMAESWNQNGIIYWYIRDNKKALESHFRALATYQKTSSRFRSL
jgi:tetratricopeptide (TPR) repeat protein